MLGLETHNDLGKALEGPSLPCFLRDQVPKSLLDRRQAHSGACLLYRDDLVHSVQLED